MKTTIRKGCVRALGGAALLGILSGCATTRESSANAGVGYDAILSTAEAEVAAGRVDRGLIGFKDAGAADPTRKEAWVRIAQIEFNNANYARAIVASEEVLQRDDSDLIADGILTVSGLRIANQSLLRLQKSGALGSNTARSEAETLATSLRATMGPELFQDDSARNTTRRRTSSPASRRATPQASAPQSTPKADPPESAPATAPATDPFKRIGGD